MAGALGFVACGALIAAALARRSRRGRRARTPSPKSTRGVYQRTLRCVGLMSGTSVDGIDVAVTDVTVTCPRAGSRLSADEATYSMKLVGFRVYPWPEEQRAAILRIIHDPHKHVALQHVSSLNFELARTFAAAVDDTLASVGVDKETVDLVCSHGQTVFHDPPHNTLQIGDPSVIAVLTGITTVGNFRVADVAAGGQGAPLASTFDWLMLRLPAQRGWRAVQNIGGIGNVTLLPPMPLSDARGSCPVGKPIAFDTGPGNVFIDMAAAECDSHLKYDADGKLGRQGKVCEPLLKHMLQHPYLSLPAPKTTGRELYSRSLFEEWTALGKARHGASSEDIVTTMTEYTAVTIARACDDYLPEGAKLAEVVVAGGGTRNPLLMERLAHHVGQLGDRVRAPGCRVATHEQVTGVDNDCKEAMIFALLGCSAVHGFQGNVPACTGARRECTLGQICPGLNWRSIAVCTCQE